MLGFVPVPCWRCGCTQILGNVNLSLCTAKALKVGRVYYAVLTTPIWYYNDVDGWEEETAPGNQQSLKLIDNNMFGDHNLDLNSWVGFRY